MKALTAAVIADTPASSLKTGILSGRFIAEFIEPVKRFSFGLFPFLFSRIVLYLRYLLNLSKSLPNLSFKVLKLLKFLELGQDIYFYFLLFYICQL